MLVFAILGVPKVKLGTGPMPGGQRPKDHPRLVMAGLICVLCTHQLESSSLYGVFNWCQFRWFEQYIALSRLCLWNSCWDIYSRTRGGSEWSLIAGSILQANQWSHFLDDLLQQKQSPDKWRWFWYNCYCKGRWVEFRGRKSKPCLEGTWKVNTCTYFPESRSYA